ncbi:hypothetical protein WH52_06730 [Tenacibaculum holothuriorum]|uniref:DUF4199 domain-containing protein n=1 Tax=Tenacibaculum holothuriorum TaxID=1635173 RepID=A0A1Y2PD83_9FLAO|nr:hypothetical protein [Tenacibaculum holothuriorum]OSY88444.1 hypothetical protein WH52_06730 [Tenacibaculum holothuriorum]
MSTTKIIIKNALLIFGGIVGFFLLMKLIGLDSTSELRLLNFVFVFWGINNAIKANINQNKDTSYINNLTIGIGTSVIAVALTIIGLMVYVGFFDTNFLSILENSSFWGRNLNLTLIIFALAIEGIASSVICSFILMQYYKNYKLAETTSV